MRSSAACRSAKAATFESLLADGEIIEVKIEGRQRPIHYALAEDATLFERSDFRDVFDKSGFLRHQHHRRSAISGSADPVSARGRAKTLFGFDYVGSVQAQREAQIWILIMPILWNEQLVARFDSKLDRGRQTLSWFLVLVEDEQLGKDEAFAVSLAKGF